jgi:hypothetical protein
MKKNECRKSRASVSLRSSSHYILVFLPRVYKNKSVLSVEPIMVLNIFILMILLYFSISLKAASMKALTNYENLSKVASVLKLNPSRFKELQLSPVLS